MTAKLPESVVVLGQRFAVEVVTGPEPPLSNGEVLGRTSMDNGRMVLNGRDGKQSPDQARDTLLHETLHAIFYLGGLRPRLKDDEEDTVQVLSTLLLDTLRRNPQLVAFLLES